MVSSFLFPSSKETFFLLPVWYIIVLYSSSVEYFCVRNARKKGEKLKLIFLIYALRKKIAFNSIKLIVLQVLLRSHLTDCCHNFHTVFENHRKSLIQHCERSHLRLHFEWTKVDQKCQKWSILASFLKT